MAIKLTFQTVVIPVSTVLSKFPGGWEEWCAKNDGDKLGPGWDDGNLFARATMDPRSIEQIILNWESMGFKGKYVINGDGVWVDFCVPETETPCDWLSYCESEIGVFLSGSHPGKIVGPKSKSCKKETVRHGITVEMALLISFTMLTGLGLLALIRG